MTTIFLCNSHFFSVLCPLLLLLSGCAGCSAPAEETPPAQRQLFAMDTLMSLTVYGPQGEAAVQAAQQELSRLDGLLSRTDPDSQISQLNARAGDGTWVPLEPETAGALEELKRRFAQTFEAAPVGRLL